MVKISVTIKHTINTGNYENVVIEMSQEEETVLPKKKRNELFDELYVEIIKKGKKIRKQLKKK